MSEEKRIRGLGLLFSDNEKERKLLTEEEKKQRDRDFYRAREERHRQEQIRREEWKKSEQAKAERMADRYTGGQAGVERWLISHL